MTKQAKRGRKGTRKSLTAIVERLGLTHARTKAEAVRKSKKYAKQKAAQ
jgi:hypothetical protein